MKYILYFTLILSALFFTAVPSAHAATYYLSPTGNDANSGTSISAPWRSFSRAWQNQSVKRGDTLILMDGVYHETLDPRVPAGTSYITIKAQNDGKAIIDGQFQRPVVQLRAHAPHNASYMHFEGLIAKNSSGAVWDIQTDHNIFKRVSGYNADPEDNNHVFSIWANHNLLEDCVAAGSGRKMILVFQREHNIIRRCFAGAQEWKGGTFCPGHWPWMENIETYNASNNIIENSIGFGIAPRPGGGINIFGQSGANADNNRVLGSMAIRAGMKWDGSQMDWSPCPGRTPSFTSCTTCPDYRTWPISHRSGFQLGNPNAGSVKNNLFQDVFAYENASLGFAVDLSSTGSQNKLIPDFLKLVSSL